MSAVSEPFAKIMLALAEAYGVTLTELRIRVYASALSDLPIEQVREAARRAMAESKFFPTVAELRQQAEGSPDDRALLAWAGLLEAASSVGAYTSLTVEDPHAGEALSVVFGSWPEFCAHADDGPALAQRRQEFLAAYRQARRAVRLGLAPRRFAGLAEPSVPLAPGTRVVAGLLSAGGTVSTVFDEPGSLLLLQGAQKGRLTTGDGTGNKL